MTLYLVEQENGELAIYTSLEQVPEDKREDVFITDSLPEGNGQLRLDRERGELYYEPYPEVSDPPVIEPPDIEPPTETKPPELSVEEMQAQILLNTEYLVSRAELGLGGI